MAREKSHLVQKCSKKFSFSLDKAVSVNEHGENCRTFRHVHISYAALHFQACASVKQGIPALSHSDKVQRRHRKIYIPSVDPAVSEFAVIQVLHFVNSAFHLLAAGHGLGGHRFHRQIHQPFVILFTISSQGFSNPRFAMERLLWFLICSR